MRRPDLLPGTGALFVPERRPGGRTLPWRDPHRTAVTGADGPRSDVGPSAVYGRGVACGTCSPAPPEDRDTAEDRGAHRPGGARPRCSPKHRGLPSYGCPTSTDRPWSVRPVPEERSRGAVPNTGDSPSRAGKRQASVLVSPASPCSANPHFFLGPKEQPRSCSPLAARRRDHHGRQPLSRSGATQHAISPPTSTGKRPLPPGGPIPLERGVGFPAFIFLPHKNSVFEPVWKTGRRCLAWSDTMAVFRCGASWMPHPKAGTQSMLAVLVGPWGGFSRSRLEVVTTRPISGVMSVRSCGIELWARASVPHYRVAGAPRLAGPGTLRRSPARTGLRRVRVGVCGDLGRVGASLARQWR